MGTSSSTLDLMSVEDVANLVGSLGAPYTKYRKMIIDNAIDGAFLSAIEDDYHFAATFENLEIDRMHKHNLRQKLMQLRSVDKTNKMLRTHSIMNASVGLTKKGSNNFLKPTLKTNRNLSPTREGNISHVDSVTRTRSSLTISRNRGSSRSIVLSSKNATNYVGSSFYTDNNSTVASLTPFQSYRSDEAPEFISGNSSKLSDLHPEDLDRLVGGLGVAFSQYKGIFSANEIDGFQLYNVLDDNQVYHSMMTRIGIENELHILLLQQKFCTLANAENRGIFSPKGMKAHQMLEDGNIQGYYINQNK